MLGRDNNGLNTEVVTPTTSDHSHLMIKKCNQHPKMILITLNYFREECCRREKPTFMLFTIISVHRTIFWNILRLMKGHRIAGWAGRQLFKLGSSMWGSMDGSMPWMVWFILWTLDTVRTRNFLQTTWQSSQMLSHVWKIKMNCFWVNFIINIFLPCSKWFPNVE